MNRRRDDFQEIDISLWPIVDTQALSASNRQSFESRRQAVEFYVAGKTLRDIERLTGINSSQLYGLLERCLTSADDGRVFGFRGLLKHRRMGACQSASKTFHLSASNTFHF